MAPRCSWERWERDQSFPPKQLLEENYVSPALVASQGGILSAHAGGMGRDILDPAMVTRRD